MITQPASVTATGHSDVLAALQTASRKTGLDFDYLLNTAMRESSLDTQAKSKSSSATGLFQFIDQTWLGLVKRFGERYGLGSYAGAIEQKADGHYAVASADTKAAILALRQDPQVYTALMAGESAKQTKQSLECALGREVCGGELYAAHFLGPSGARRLIQLNESNPDARADIAFAQAAKANKATFYHADGSAKSVGELYASIVNRPSVQMPSLPQKPVAEPKMVASTPSETEKAASIMAAFSEPSQTDSAAAVSDVDIPQPIHNGFYRGWRGNQFSAPVETRPLPQSPVLLTPGIVEILASLSPVTTNRRAA